MTDQTTTTARACRHCGATTDLALRGLGVLDARYYECREGCPTATAPLDPDAIAARVQAATEGPWTAHGDGLVWADRPGDPVSGSTEQADAEFIAAARRDVPALIAEVRRLRAALTDISGHCPCRQEYCPSTRARSALVGGEVL